MVNKYCCHHSRTENLKTDRFVNFFKEQPLIYFVFIVKANSARFRKYDIFYVLHGTLTKENDIKLVKQGPMLMFCD